MERAYGEADDKEGGPLGALRHREFRILWIGTVVSNIGTWMHIVAQGWLMFELTDSPFWLGMVGLMRAIPLLAFPLFGGVVADRISRLKVLYWTQISALLLAAAWQSVTAFGIVRPWHILGFSFLSATVLAFDSPARQAMLPDLVGPRDVMHAISLNSWAFNGAVLLGPTFAALLLPVVGIAGVFYLNAASFGAVLIALALLDVTGGVIPLGTARQNLLEGLRYIADSPAIFALVLMTAVVSLLGRSYSQLMPVFARDILGRDISGLSMLYTAAGAGTCIGAMFLIFVGNPKHKGLLAVGAGITFAVALGMFAVSRSFWLSSFLLLVLGAALIAFSTSVSTLLQTLAPKELRGRVMSVNTLAWQGLEYLGVLITGTLATLWTAPIVVAGAAMLIFALLAAVAIRVAKSCG